MESLKKRWDEWITSLTKKDATSDKDAKIKATQIVYVVGPGGTGKVCSSSSVSYVLPLVSLLLASRDIPLTGTYPLHLLNSHSLEIICT